MKVLGVTGGSGSGKTVVCRILKEQGGKIIDADKITRKLQEPGQPVYNEIKEYFGNDIIAADGAIEREKTRKDLLPSGNSAAFLIGSYIRAFLRKSKSALKHIGNKVMCRLQY